jgi:glutaredoxin-like protein
VVLKEEPLSGEKAREFGIRTDPTVMIGEDRGYRIIFNGAPAGHEFTSVVETLQFVSRGESGLSPENQARIEASTGTARVQVFVTAECPLCPQSVLLSHRVAVASKGRITSECVEAAENPVLSGEFNVSSVPQQVINSDKSTVTVGVQSETAFVDQILKNLK